MRKLLVLLAVVLLVLVTAGSAMAAPNGLDGPAPSMGDGASDGSGFTNDDRANVGDGMGPAPNSGDGISDGSGF